MATTTRLRLTREQVEFRRKWAAELRSGRWKQTRLTLRRDKCCYCCVGVACHLLGREVAFCSDASEHYDAAYMAIGGIGADRDLNVSRFTKMNDNEGLTFAEIAARIDAETDAAEVIDTPATTEN